MKNLFRLIQRKDDRRTVETILMRHLEMKMKFRGLPAEDFYEKWFYRYLAYAKRKEMTSLYNKARSWIEQTDRVPLYDIVEDSRKRTDALWS
jgi:hypothetical protein